jgi:hypothetical protein
VPAPRSGAGVVPMNPVVLEIVAVIIIASCFFLIRHELLGHRE